MVSRRYIGAETDAARRLVTAPLWLLYRIEPIRSQLKSALDSGLTKDELVEMITHLEFYAGWPNAMTAFAALNRRSGGDRAHGNA